jgi:hypothetical protein
MIKYLVFVAFFAVAFGQIQTLGYPSFSSSTSGDFQFNNDASLSGNQFILTTSDYSQAGSIFYKNSIPLTGPSGFRASFSAAFSFIMDQGSGYDGSGNGADGITFVLNTVSNTAGSIGGGIGYSGILNSVGIDTNGNIRSITQRSYPTLWNDGNTHYAWIDFNGDTELLEVRVADTNTRRATAYISATLDLVSILASPNVYVGWTAATGGAKERHVINNFYFTNQYAPIITQTCGNGIFEGTEACDGSSCCTTTCTLASSGTTCRASAGVCDVAETCSGTSSTCPADSFQSSSTVCRPSAGVCDVAEICSGSSASCPADGFQSSSVVCRASIGPCDPSEIALEMLLLALLMFLDHSRLLALD